MKRIRTILSVLFISLLTLSSASGQEKKDQKKVKIVIADKSGTKVLMDTAFTWTSKTDSIITEGGNVIYIGKPYKDDPDSQRKQFKVIAHVNKDGENSDHQYIFIDDGKVIRSEGDNSFHITVSDDEFDNDTEKNRCQPQRRYIDGSAALHSALCGQDHRHQIRRQSHGRR